MKIVTAAEMQDIDKLASNQYGVPGILLMDQASKAVADVVLHKENFKDVGNGKIIVFCGKGNNGGDGFGAARYLYNAGLEVTVFLVNATVTSLKGDAAAEADMLVRAGVDIKCLQSENDLLLVKPAIIQSDIIVDAMLGTGFKGELCGLYLEVCKLINSMDKLVVAVDIPTGVDADFGLRAENAINADVTVTMALPKSGILLYPAKENVGELVVAAIGMPNLIFENCPSNKYLLEKKDIAALLPARRPNAHKGDAGRVIVAAGSPGFTGAAALCSFAAVKAGAGLVSLLTPMCSRDVLSTKLTEVMVHGLVERMPGVLGSAAIGDVLQRVAKADVFAIGPGLGTYEATQQTILEILKKVTKPVVIDADAITALKGHMDILPQMQVPKVLTPHPGEMARITGVDIETIDRERINVATHYAKEWKAVVVLKGAPTVIALPEGNVYINPTGCNAMATGGCGDVLTGIIAGYIASGMSVADATLAAVYLHGLAGELASQNEIGLAASEIPLALAEARKSLYIRDESQFSIYNSSLKMVK